MVKPKYDQLPCEAQITVNEQLFRYGLNTYLSLIGVSAVSDGMTDSDAFDVDVPLAGACIVDGVDIEEVYFGKVSGNGRKLRSALDSFLRTLVLCCTLTSFLPASKWSLSNFSTSYRSENEELRLIENGLPNVVQSHSALPIGGPFSFVYDREGVLCEYKDSNSFEARPLAPATNKRSALPGRFFVNRDT